MPGRGRARPKPLKTMNTKPLLQSSVIWGAGIAIISRLVGISMVGGEAQELADNLTSTLPLLAGLGADAAAAVERVRATQFDVHWYRSKVFWAAILSGLMGVLQAAGVDWQGLEEVPDRVAGAVTAVGGLVGAVVMLIGRARASKKIVITQPDPT